MDPDTEVVPCGHVVQVPSAEELKSPCHRPAAGLPEAGEAMAMAAMKNGDDLGVVVMASVLLKVRSHQTWLAGKSPNQMEV